MNKLHNLLFKVPIDKQLHHLHCYRAAVVIFCIILVSPALRDSLRVYEMAIISFVLSSLIIGVGKEIMDLRKGGSGFNFPDLLYSMYGAFEASLTIGLTFYIIAWTEAVLLF